MIFDSHAHYDVEQFDEDREQVVRELKENGVIGVLNCGSSLHGARESVRLAEENEIFYAAAGIHPENADEFNSAVSEELKQMLQKEKVVAVGEIGLDYYCDENPPKDLQLEVFKAQMELAREYKLPVIIHDRDAHEDTLNVLKSFPEVKGVLHCFSGSVEFARECLKLGYYLGFTGVVTFKNAKKAVEVVSEIPLDRLLLETDCPYMAPEPHRGKRNRSEYIEYIITKVAEIRGVTREEIEVASINNTKSLLNIK